MEQYIEELLWIYSTRCDSIRKRRIRRANVCTDVKTWPFSSEVKPDAASTFSRILLSFITLVAHTYPCLSENRKHLIVWITRGKKKPLLIALTCAAGWLSQCVTVLGSLCNTPHRSLSVASAELCPVQSWRKRDCTTELSSVLLFWRYNIINKSTNTQSSLMW